MIQLTKTQTTVVLSKAKELEFIGQPGVGKTFAGLAKIMIWLQESRNRTGFFAVSSRYTFENTEKHILNLWSSLGVYNSTDKSFCLANGSKLFIISTSELNYDDLGGMEYSSFVIDANVTKSKYAFALVKTHQYGFVLKCTLGDENTLIEKTTFLSENPYLKG